MVAHLKGLGPSEAARERTLLDSALTIPNADRAVMAYDRIQTVASTNAAAAKRLTPAIRESLVRGVAERRTADSVGQEGVLGVKQAQEAAKAVVAMPSASYNALSKSLFEVGGGVAASPKADPRAERALLLKVVAARADRLAPSFVDDALTKTGVISKTESDKAMREVTSFAKYIQGLSREELIRTTTGLDINRANTSTTDPYALPTAGTDSRGNNDGLYQRFESTCGPATAQLTRSEADPVYARRLHQDGMANADTKTATAHEQDMTLAQPRFYNGSQEIIPTKAQWADYSLTGALPAGATSVEEGASTSRRANQAAARLGVDVAALTPAATKEAQVSLHKLVFNQPMTSAEQTLANNLLTRVRQASGGHPTVDEVRWMQSERSPVEKGMQLPAALRDVARPATHADYEIRGASANTVTATDLTAVGDRLQQGQDVPFRISNATNSGGHFMLMSDVRGQTPNRSFLVSDPYSGRTAWVSEANLTNASSTWVKDQFNLGWTQVTHTFLEK